MTQSVVEEIMVQRDRESPPVRFLKVFVTMMRTAYFWLMLVTVTLTLWILVLLAQTGVALGLFGRHGHVIHRIASLWGKMVMGLMPGWKVVVEGREHLPADGKAVVFVANHESMTDIWAMYYLGTQFRWLSKDSVFKIPIIGRAMKWCGYVSVNRKSRESGAEAMRISAEKLRLGIPMFFFPEGTRSTDGQVKKFKLGAFKLAQGANVDIQPIVIYGAGALFSKGSGVPGARAHVRLKVLPALSVPAGENQLEIFADRVREQIISCHTEFVQEGRRHEKAAH